MNQDITLHYAEGSSDKIYQAQLVEENGLYLVNFQYGRRGNTLVAGTKTPAPVPYEQALKAYNTLVKSKQAKGYKEVDNAEGSVYTYVATSDEERATGNYPQLLNSVDEEMLEALFNDPNYIAQEKHDGKRMMLCFEDGKAFATNRKGLVCGAPQVVLEDFEVLARFQGGGGKSIIDGESVGDKFYAFDILYFYGEDLTSLPYIDRNEKLKEFIDNSASSSIILVGSAVTRDDKANLFKNLQNLKLEGIVFKELHAPYQAGRPNSGGTQLKFKFQEEATCRVSSTHPTKQSFSVEVTDGNGGYINKGNVTVPHNKEMPEVGQFVEIRYLWVLKGGSLYQPFFKGIRDDKTEADLESSLKIKGGSE